MPLPPLDGTDQALRTAAGHLGLAWLREAFEVACGISGREEASNVNS
jgi:hypothetical protein